MRISRHLMFMEIAHVVKKRATCFRLNVGAVIVHNKSIVAIGYNGPPAGEPHCTGKDCTPPGSGCVRALHAEVNALKRLPLDLRGEWLLDLYVTDSPCSHCLEIIERHAIRAVYFSNLYRINEHLKTTSIDVYQVMSNGVIIDFKTGEIIDGNV